MLLIWFHSFKITFGLQLCVSLSLIYTVLIDVFFKMQSFCFLCSFLNAYPVFISKYPVLFNLCNKPNFRSYLIPALLFLTWPRRVPTIRYASSCPYPKWQTVWNVTSASLPHFFWSFKSVRFSVIPTFWFPSFRWPFLFDTSFRSSHPRQAPSSEIYHLSVSFVNFLGPLALPLDLQNLPFWLCSSCLFLQAQIPKNYNAIHSIGLVLLKTSCKNWHPSISLTFCIQTYRPSRTITGVNLLFLPTS